MSPFVLIRVAAAAFGVAALAMLPLTLFSERIGLLDHPNTRKIHRDPTPLVGGLAVYSGVVISLFFGGFIEGHVLLLLAASLVVMALGVIDDRFDLHSSFRLLGQILIATALCAQGVSFRLFGIAALDWAITIAWMVGVINAFNCIDCADGIAGAVALVCFVFFGILASLGGRHFVTQLNVAGAAAVVGFLYYNRPKAHVFLGDTGSTLLGLMLASLSILSVPKSPTPQIPWPAVTLLVPVYDIILVHFRRYRGGITNLRDLLASTGKDHLPHRLFDRGFSAWKAMAVMAGLTAIAGGAGWHLAVGSKVVGSALLVVACMLLWRIERMPCTAPVAPEAGG